MITTTNLVSGVVLGARLRVNRVVCAATWQQRPAPVAFYMIDNSTGVSAQERRHR